ncbi:MAG TPA: type II toxin-antitoxin system PemK/MazF family toxin, partial [Brevibacterium epidermidis]|nr:type II toxin-antitoxin system PemK/MazF family toxin [Brevibacterium epidermidis]
MNWKSLVNRAARIGVREGLRYLRQSQSKKNSGGSSQPTDARRQDSPRSGGGGAASAGSADRGGSDGQGGSGSYPGDFTGSIKVSYSPDLDGDADPGEVVWGWV